MSTAEAARILEISSRAVQRSLKDPDRRVEQWGGEGEGWRYKPLSTRRIYQVRRSWVERMAAAGE